MVPTLSSRLERAMGFTLTPIGNRLVYTSSNIPPDSRGCLLTVTTAANNVQTVT